MLTVLFLLAASVMYLNSMSVTWTARIQILLTLSKLLAIAIIIVPGMYQLFKGETPLPFPENIHCFIYSSFRKCFNLLRCSLMLRLLSVPHDKPKIEKVLK